MMPDGAEGAGTSSAVWGLDSMFLMIGDENSTAVLGNYKGRGMLGYDPNKNKYVLSMFNNFGGEDMLAIDETSTPVAAKK